MDTSKKIIRGVVNSRGLSRGDRMTKTFIALALIDAALIGAYVAMIFVT